MHRRLLERIQHLAISHCQIDECGVAEVQVGTWQLLWIPLEHRRLLFSRIEAHLITNSRNGSEMDM